MINLIVSLYKKEYLEDLSKSLKNINTGLDVKGFIIARIIVLIVTIVTCLLYKVSFFNSVLLLILIYGLYNYIFLTRHIIKRNEQIKEEGEKFFNILLLNLNNKNILDALTITCELVPGILSNEIKNALIEIKFGINHKDAFTNLYNRLSNTKFASILFVLKENNKEELTNAIYNYKELEFNKLNKKINMISNKILLIFILVGIPLIMLLIFCIEIIKYL